MLNKTAMIHPAFLAKVGRAMRRALILSAGPYAFGRFVVRNHRNELALVVVHHRGRFCGFEFFDAAGRDVTGQVIGALRQHGMPESAQ